MLRTAAACMLLLALHGAAVAQQDAIIGKAGDAQVREVEFLERLELLPPLSVRSRRDAEFAKYEVLYSLIAEKLLAQEAERRGYHREQAFAESMKEIRKLYARDALYMDEVRNRVSLSEGEIQQGMERARLEIHIEFLYFEKKEDAEFLATQLLTGDIARIDTTIAVIRDTATVIFGDADPSIEDAAYQLRGGDWSPVVSAGTGYYLLHAQRRRVNPYYTGLPPQELREQVSALLVRRKEQSRAGEFVQGLLKDRTGYGKRGAILALAESVARNRKPWTSFFTDSLYAAVMGDLTGRRIDTIAVAGDRIWSVGEFAERLYRRSFPLAGNDTRELAARFNEELQLLVRQELLAQEGLRRRLDERPDIAARIRSWYEQHLSNTLKAAISSSVAPTSAQVWSYLADRDSVLAIPSVTIRELVSSSMDALTSAVEELERGEDFEEVIRRWSRSATARTSDGLTRPFRITERPPIGEIAWSLNPGERFGPVREDTAFVIFELVSKHSEGARADTTERFERAAQELHTMMVKKATDTFIARLAQTHGYEIYPERVEAVSVSGTPMMTYRFLGFGGRMFAVPMLDRQIDWLGADPGGETLP